jgi:hypothetical protein
MSLGWMRLDEVLGQGLFTRQQLYSRMLHLVEPTWQRFETRKQ